jgi:hypothetical protein
MKNIFHKIVISAMFACVYFTIAFALSKILHDPIDSVAAWLAIGAICAKNADDIMN